MSKRGRIRQAWISLLLVLVMTVQLLPLSVLATGETAGEPALTTVAQGSCGPADESGVNADNAAWVLTSDGTLTISGSGKLDRDPAWNIDTTPIKSVVIGEGITEIVSKVGWWDAETLSLPASLTAFDAGIISGFRSLKSITLTEGSETYKLVDGALLSKDGTVLHWHPRNASDATAYDVPSGVKTIGDYALYGHNSLNTITLPEGLVTIGNHAFNSCGNLNGTLTIPSTVKVMGEYCLSYNNELQIIIPADSVLETIGKGAMSDNYTEEMTLPATLKSVGAWSLPFGLKTGAILTFLSRTVTFADEAIYEGSTVYGYPGSTVEAYANALNSNDIEWDDINFIPLESVDPALTGQGKTIGFLPELLTGSAPNYATALSGAGTKSMGLAGERVGISLVSGSVSDEASAVLTKLTFKLQLQAHLADSAQAIPQPSFALGSAKDADTTLTVDETTTDEQLASGARHYTVTMENGSFADGEIVLTCAYANGLSGFYDTFLRDVQAVYAYADGSKTGEAVQPARVVSVSYFAVDNFVVGEGTAVEIVPGALNTADDAESLFAGGWQRGSLPAAVEGKPAIYQTAQAPATVSLCLTPSLPQTNYARTTVKCYLSDSAADYASGELLRELSFTDGSSFSTAEALVKAHPIQLTLPRQAADTVKYLTAEVTTLYARSSRSESVVKTHTAAIVTKADNAALYSVSADGVLTGYDGSEQTMTLPARVGEINVKKVGALAEGTLYGTDSVVLSAGIEALADDAFRGFRGLTALRLPESVKTVGSGALATGGSALTLRVDSMDAQLPAFAADAVDLTATRLTVQCYAGSAAETWANALREAAPERVTVMLLDASRALRLEIKNSAGQTLGKDSFLAVEWFREGSDTVLSRNTSYTLPEGVAIGPDARYVCRVTFSPATRWDYTVPASLSCTFDRFGTQSYQLQPRDRDLTVKGSFRPDQIDDAFRAYLTVQEPDGALRIDLPVTRDNAAFSVELSGRYPATLYAENASGGKLTMPDVQSRPIAGDIIDLGELTLPSRNIQQTIASKRVYSPDNWRMLSTLTSSGRFVLLDEAGSEFTDFTLSLRSSSYNQTCWLVLNLGSSVRDSYFVGDTLTLHQIPSNDFGYRLEDAEITLQLGTQTADSFDLAVKVSARLDFYGRISSDYYVFDEAGALVSRCSWGSSYVDPGTYTVIGIRKNAFITSLSSLTELEELGIPAENYLKETVTLAAAEAHSVSVTPDFLKNTITLTATADAQMMANGLVPVYIRYHNPLAEQFGQEQDWQISIVSTGSSREASLPLEKLDGKYAYCTDGEIVSETTGYTTGSYRYEKLDLTVRGAAGSICLYAEASGRTLTIQAVNTGIAAKLELPRENISMTAPERSTAQTEGNLRLYAQLSQYAGVSYLARVYVDNALQSEKPLSVSGTGENLLPYRLTRYSDGSSSHTVCVEVLRKTGEGEERIWSSDDYHVLLLPSGDSAAEPVNLSLRMFMAREDYHGNLQLVKSFDLQSGSFGKLNYTLYPVDFNDDNTLKNDMVLDYQLTMTNPELVRNGRVVLRIYSGSETAPAFTDLTLRRNPTTGTFDGTFTLEGGTYSISDVPFGYDLRYYSDAELDISMEQLAAEIAQREEKTSSELPEESLLGADPVDMEALEYLLTQLPADEFTEEDKQALRDICIEHNDWCARFEESRAAVFAELEEITGIEPSEDMTTEDLLAMLGEFTGGLMPELLEEGDNLLDPEYLLSNGYLPVRGTALYVYVDVTSGYTSVVDLDACVHVSVGEAPQRGRMTRAMARSSEAMDTLAGINSVVQSVKTMTALILEAIMERLEDFAVGEFRTDAQKFRNVDLKSVENLEKVVAANIEGAAPLRQEAWKLKLAMERFKIAMVTDDLGNMQAALAHINTLKIQKLPLAHIATVVGFVFDIYEVCRFKEEITREIKNCDNEIYTAWAHLNRLRSKINSSEECKDALSGYLPACIEAVEDLETDANDIMRIQQARYICRIQAIGLDALCTTCGIFMPKKIEIAASVATFAINNVSEASAYISLIKNMHELESDWDDIQESCIDPLRIECGKSESSGGDGGGGSGGNPGGSGGPDGGDGGGWDGLDDPYGRNDRNSNSSGNGTRPDIYLPSVPVIDPAGYVYEAVESNRVEGAKAKIWYRDESGRAAAWDEAPEFGEEPVQITGSDGRFSWMTPPGGWLVTVSKSGYAPADSSEDSAAVDGWLPVPPPQMNVNIALTSLHAPAVVSAQAAADVIRVVFSQYMDTAQFAGGALLTVTQNGEAVPLTVSFPDEEAGPADESVFYGRVLELRRADGEPFADGVSLTVDQSAKNYAGTTLEEAYSSGSLTVQPIPGSIAHSYPNRFVTEVGAAGTLAVRVLDTTGKPLAGVTVTAMQETGGTLALAGSAVSDSSGRAVFTVEGLASGYDRILFSAGTVRAEMNTRVAPLSTMKPQKPAANLTDYQVVSAGTQLILTAQAEAAIRYTTNNTCPCTDEALTYTGPITLEESGEYFFRIAAWTEAGGYSERLNLHLTVQPDETAPDGPQPDDEKPARRPQFSDVPADAYYAKAVDWAVERGITLGIGGGRFDPDTICTRAQIVTFLWRATGRPEPAGMGSFDDVPTDAYYAKAVAWAVEKGITLGVGGGKFAPDLPCTRAQIVTLLHRAAGSPAVSGGAAFSDVAADAYYTAAVAWAAQQGITLGIGGGLFGGELDCSRAQIVTFLYRSAMAK